MMIQNRRHNQRPIQNGRHQNRVLELGKLVAEPAVRRVPYELFPRTSDSAGASHLDEWSGIPDRKGNQGSGGDKESDSDDEGEENWYSVIVVSRGSLLPFSGGGSAGVMDGGIHRLITLRTESTMDKVISCYGNGLARWIHFKYANPNPSSGV